MDSFKTLPRVIVTSDGDTIKETEELAIVIGLTVKKMKRQLKQDQKILELNRQRVTLVITGVIILLALIATSWVQGKAISGGMIWVIGGTISGLIAAALLYIYIPRSNRFSVKPGEASITSIKQFYWPIGILPLSEERSLLWDPLTPTDNHLQIMPLVADWGIKHKDVIESSQSLPKTLHVLLAAREELTELRTNKKALWAWPLNQPDESLQQLANEVSDLWPSLHSISPEILASTIGLSQNQSDLAPEWQALIQAANQLQEFYLSYESLQTLLDSYGERSQELVKTTHEILLEYGWQTISDVENDRATYFSQTIDESAEPSQAPPTIPSAPFRLTISDSRTQIEKTLRSLQSALIPLDSEITAQLSQFRAQEATELQAAEEEAEEYRQQLIVFKEEIESTDSSIFKLILVLEDQQSKLYEDASLIQHGILSLAQLPLATLQGQVEELSSIIHDTSSLIRESNLKLELISVERSIERLKESIDHGLAEWQTLTQQIPQHSQEVSQKVEIGLEILKRLATYPPLEKEERLEEEIQAAIKDLEQVPRALISWSARQDSPIDAVEDNNNQLSAQIVALRDYRHKLELASRHLTALSYANSGHSITLPDSLEQIKNALQRFTELSNESRSAIRTMDQAAENISKQADKIGELLKKREELLDRYKQKVSGLQEAELKERQQIRQRWQRKRELIELKRTALNRLQKDVQERLNRPRLNPDIHQSGIIMDTTNAFWAERVVNWMNNRVEQWAQRIAGIKEATELERLQHELKASHQQIKAHSLLTKLTTSDKQSIPTPQLCFVPFWIVESQNKPSSKDNPEQMIHIFPPQQLKNSLDTEITTIPIIEKLAYTQLTNRLLSYLRHDKISAPTTEQALSFSPANLSEPKQLNYDAASPSPQTLADALAQYWLLFRPSDPAIVQIIQNSRIRLIPEEVKQ